MDAILLYIVAGSKEQAGRIASALLDARLIACANILPEMVSLYDWEGQRETAQECLLLAKTTAPRLQEAMEMARRLHSYECPCIVALPLTAGYPPFLEWIAAQTK